MEAKTKRCRMEAKVREALKLNPNGGGTSEDDLPDRLVVPRQKDAKVSLYEGLILSGIRVDRVNPGFLSCSFTVPRYLTVSPPDLFVNVIKKKKKKIPNTFSVKNRYRTGMEISLTVPLRTLWTSSAVPCCVAMAVSIPKCRSTCLYR